MSTTGDEEMADVVSMAARAPAHHAANGTEITATACATIEANSARINAIRADVLTVVQLARHKVRSIPLLCPLRQILG
jgi:hypothetical protein